MSAIDLNASPRINDLMLIICDAAGRITAVSTTAPRENIPCSPVARQHFAEIFGEDAAITRWLTDHINRARRENDYFAEINFETDKGLLQMRLESLMCEHEIYGYALRLAPAGARMSVEGLEEGDSVVNRKQWHEIKNYIGGMKLYATFLTKKLPDGDERQTVEKMLSGINNLIDYLAKIRRGETQ